MLELRQHLEHARDQLADARNHTVSKIGRFNAAYGASHALLTAAIKLHGYRPAGTGHRQTLFVLAAQLMPGAAAAQAVIADAHFKRNRHEYDGAPILVTDSLLDALVEAVTSLDEEVCLAVAAHGRRPGAGA